MSIPIKCTQLSLISRNQLAVNKLDFTLEAGQIVGLFGPSASGKTCLLKLIGGLILPTHGTIEVFGQSPCVATKEKIAYLPQVFSLPLWMTVSQVIDYFATFYPDFSKETAEKLLPEFEIKASSKLQRMSRQKGENLHFILTLARKADIYLLDKPKILQDAQTASMGLSLLEKYLPSTATVLLTSQNMEGMDDFLDQVLFLKKGILALHQPVAQIQGEGAGSVEAAYQEVFAC